MHGDVLPRMWKIIYRWCGKWKGWTEKCVARFVRWEICHWTLLWKRISLWYYCSVLDKNHGISMNSRTLKRGLREYGLRRRNEFHSEHEVWEMIKREIEGPSSLFGYRAMWNKLQCCCPVRNGHGLHELDLQASTLRKARKLLCRSFISRGPNEAWHVNGYDKLKPYGLPMHGYVNGFSRRILWLKVCKSNNCPVIQASFSSMQWKKADCNQCYYKQIAVWLPYSAFYPVKRLHIVVHFQMPISTSKIGSHIVKGASPCGS